MWPEVASLYNRVRALEGRMYDDDMVARLPAVPTVHPHAGEWRARATSSRALAAYLRKHWRAARVLEVGCGNGWLSNRMAARGDLTVLGIDQNLAELRQAGRVFGRQPGLAFAAADPLMAPLQAGGFEVIVLASVVQYFCELEQLITRLLPLVRPGGEVHVLDSPFYTAQALPAARARSREHYTRLGVPEMAAHYFHHSRDYMIDLGATLVYEPLSVVARFKRALGLATSPFPWFRLKR